MRRVLAFSVLAAALGCQCLVPVAGHPANGDAGMRADGGGALCSSWSECPRSDAGSTFCPSTVPSCVGGRCLSECSTPSRTCTVEDGGSCLRCSEPATASCGTCARSRRCTFTVERGGCPAPFVDGADFEVAPNAGGPAVACGGAIRRLDGGATLGTWNDLSSGGEGLLSIPSLGGWCVATVLATGAPRAAIACPVCTFIEVGCE